MFSVNDGVDAEWLVPEKLAAVRRSILDRGYAVLEGAISPGLIEEARIEYLRMFSRMRHSKDLRLEDSSSGMEHFQLQPELDGVFGQEIFMANPSALACIESILGPDIRLSFYNSNIVLPGSDFQRVHRDVSPTFNQDPGVPTPPTQFVVNILLTDFTIENGSTEVWPATHLIVDGAGEASDTWIRRERVDGWPGVRTNALAGSLIIRDMCLWHRGTPNRTEAPRIMLALCYKRSWIRWRHDRSLDASVGVLSGWSSRLQRLVQPD